MAESIYDEEFDTYLRIARELIRKITTEQDKDICVKWIRRLKALDSEDLVVKKNRNQFFRYLLQVMRDGVVEGVLDSPLGLTLNSSQKRQIQEEVERIGVMGAETYLVDEILSQAKPPFISQWSKDRRTYVAAKPIPGRGALIYMAVAKIPSLGWYYPEGSSLAEKMI